MSCLPPSNKCEWNDLRHFVDHLNRTENTDFTRTRCLDLCSTTKQPEVLCTATSNDTLVIERKSVIWPEDYAAQHSAEHRFFGYLEKEVSPHLQSDMAYELCLQRVVSTRDVELREIAKNIGLAVAVSAAQLPNGEVLHLEQTSSCTLRMQNSWERDETAPQYGLSISTPEPGATITNDDGGISANFAGRLTTLLASAPQKFANYESARRVVLLQPISAALYCEMDQCGKSVLDDTTIPDCVHEVWLGFNYDGESWNYSRIYLNAT